MLKARARVTSIQDHCFKWMKKLKSKARKDMRYVQVTLAEKFPLVEWRYLSHNAKSSSHEWQKYLAGSMDRLQVAHFAHRDQYKKHRKAKHMPLPFKKHYFTRARFELFEYIMEGNTVEVDFAACFCEGKYVHENLVAIYDRSNNEVTDDNTNLHSKSPNLYCNM